MGIFITGFIMPSLVNISSFIKQPCKLTKIRDANIVMPLGLEYLDFQQFLF